MLVWGSVYVHICIAFWKKPTALKRWCQMVPFISIYAVCLSCVHHLNVAWQLIFSNKNHVQQLEPIKHWSPYRRCPKAGVKPDAFWRHCQGEAPGGHLLSFGCKGWWFSMVCPSTQGIANDMIPDLTNSAKFPCFLGFLFYGDPKRHVPTGFCISTTTLEYWSYVILTRLLVLVNSYVNISYIFQGMCKYIVFSILTPQKTNM